MRLLRLSLPSLFLWLRGMARTRWPPTCETPAPARARQIGPAAPVGALNDQDPADGPVSGQPSYGVRPYRAPALQRLGAPHRHDSRLGAAASDRSPHPV